MLTHRHALQLRQAKLSFPNVHLIVGVVSSALCAKHKNQPILDSAERYEAVRNCRWVDEVVEDAPWVIDESFMDKLQIDYVAHDELPYAMTSSGAVAASDDVYDWIKKIGKFLPTRRTEGVSTSDLIVRIVSMYRDGVLDGKLKKLGIIILQRLVLNSLANEIDSRGAHEESVYGHGASACQPGGAWPCKWGGVSWCNT